MECQETDRQTDRQTDKFYLAFARGGEVCSQYSENENYTYHVSSGVMRCMRPVATPAKKNKTKKQYTTGDALPDNDTLMTGVYPPLSPDSLAA